MDRLIVPFRYTGGLQRALKRVKYSSSWDVVSQLVDVLIGAAPEELSLDASWEVSAVPLYVSKERSRGFNQAEAMGVSLARVLGLQYASLLSRKRATRAQYGLGKKEREENVRGAFAISNKLLATGHELAGRNILLVDDVWTTGATMKECAKVLKRNGVREAWGIALAR